MRSRSSLLGRLVLGYAASFVMLLALSDLSLYYLLHQAGEAERSSLLNDRFNAVSELLRTPEGGQSELLNRINTEWPSRAGGPVYLQLRDGHGKLIAQTPNLPPWLDWKALEGRLGEIVHVEGAQGTTLMARLDLMDDRLGIPGPVRVFGFESDAEGQLFLQHFRQLSVAILLVSGLLSSLLGWRIAKQGLWPLARMTETVGRIRTDTLHARLSLEELPAELRPLARAFNETLDRLEESFSRMGRFSSDIAHELRTPLSSIQGQIEVAIRRPREVAEYVEVLGSALEECSRLRKLVESLLFLARAENSPGDVAREPVDLATEISAVIEFFEPAATDAGIALRLDSRLGPSARILAERTLFQQATGNLLSNAIRYTPQGGHVAVRASESEGLARIEIEDDGPGIAAEHLPRIFDRFYRTDAARNMASGGFGLGLSIAKSIVELHHGRISMRSELGKGTCVRIEWPLASS